MPDAVTLREITPQNEADVRALAVAPGQEEFVASVAESLEEAATTPDARPWCRAIYADEVPVGFVMLSYDVPPGRPSIRGGTSCGVFSSMLVPSAVATVERRWSWSSITSGRAPARPSS